MVPREVVEFKPVVSCIVPVYNADKHLRQGLDSLIAQTYQNLELILVDDMSTDDSWQICQSYARNYENVKAYQNIKNSGGPLRGRERGIQEASGEWITFMDCDDYVTSDYVNNLVSATNNGKYDIVVTGHSRLYEDGRLEDFDFPSFTETTEHRLASLYSDFLEKNWYKNPANTVGQNLVRASIAKSVDLAVYPNVLYGEDIVMALAFLANSKNGVNFVDSHDFIWRQVDGSMSHGGVYKTADKQEFYTACFDIFHRKKVYDAVSAKSPLVSVIIPVYNVEKYLDACLNSVSSQSYRNLEVILVDDGSNDASGEKCDDWAKKHEYIKVLHKKNEGLNYARKDGYRLSSGEYVTFVDSDDLIHQNFIQTLLEELIFNKCDVSIVRTRDFMDSEVSSNITKKGHTATHVISVQSNKEDIVKNALLGVGALDNKYFMTAWGKLYKRKYLDKVNWKVSNLRAYEDNFWTPQLLCMAEVVVHISDKLYLYRRNKNGETLGSKQTGNTLNGKTVGYLERNELLHQFNKALAKKHGVYIDNMLAELYKSRTLMLIGHLIDSGNISEENNLFYVKKIWPQHLVEYHERNQLIVNLKEQNTFLEAQLASFMGIKRSSRLLIGNIKRRIKGAKR